MAHLSLQVKNRTIQGNQVRKLRRDGILPAVIYSNKLPSVSVELTLGEFNKIFKQSGKNHVIDIKIDDKKTYPCIVHDLDIHPVTGVVRHVDFLFVNLKEKVVASVPVTLIGESIAIKELGGILNSMVDELEVSALPDNIPAEIVIDISSIENFGDTIRVEDLGKSKTYEIQEEPDFVIVSVSVPSAEEPEEAPVVEDVAAETTSTEDKNTEENNN